MKNQKILLSIHPEFVKQIIAGTKKFEYRKVLPKGKFDTVVIYSTYPIKQVIGECEFIGYFIGPPKTIWKMTKDYSGVEKERYFSYYRDNKNAIAFKLGKVTVYDTPKTLADFGLDNVPQSFVYL